MCGVVWCGAVWCGVVRSQRGSFNATIKSAIPLDANCARFGNEGTGANCAIKTPLEPGTRYTLTARVESAGPNGTIWRAEIQSSDRETGTATTTLLGRLAIKVPGKTGGQCGEVLPAAYSFEEYFTGGNFYAAVSWEGPVLRNSRDGRALAPVDVLPHVGGPATCFHSDRLKLNETFAVSAS